MRIGPFVGGELTVVSFEEYEVLSQPFVYDVVFSSSLSEDELQLGIFGFPGCLSIHSRKPHEPRVIQGLAVGFEAIGASDAELSSNTRRFMTRIVPRLWLAKHQRRSRVFQGKTAVQIAKTVLEANGIKADVQVGSDDYPPIPFEYQRNETDLEFLHRVLATAGIFYYFRHANGLFNQLVPGAGAAAGEVGALAGAAGRMLGGAAAGVTGFVSDAESTLGMTTTLVLTDKAASTEQLGDTSLDAAATFKDPLSSALGAATGALGGALGSAVGAVASAVGLTGKSDALVFDGNGQAASTDTERVYAFRLLKEVRAKQMSLRNWNLREAQAFTATKKSAPATAGVNLALSASIDLTGKASFGLGAAKTLTPTRSPSRRERSPSSSTNVTSAFRASLERKPSARQSVRFNKSEAIGWSRGGRQTAGGWLRAIGSRSKGTPSVVSTRNTSSPRRVRRATARSISRNPNRATTAASFAACRPESTPSRRNPPTAGASHRSPPS